MLLALLYRSLSWDMVLKSLRGTAGISGMILFIILGAGVWIGLALLGVGWIAMELFTSRPAGADTAWTLEIEGGAKSRPKPAAHRPGTRVEVRDLFFATPARLKFMKGARTELTHAVDAVKRLAMAHPEVAFNVSDGERTMPLPQRAKQE